MKRSKYTEEQIAFALKQGHQQEQQHDRPRFDDDGGLERRRGQ
ncbi:hypothetical protein ACXIUT_04980 [Achromobacter denitrificans]